MSKLSLARRVILLADDEVMIRNLVRMSLEDQGYGVLAAADGNEAIEISRAQEGRIDLLLTDLEMPHVGGIRAFQEISAERADIKVLFMSGGGAGHLELPRSSPFLRKPFQLKALRGKISELLSPNNPSPESLKVILVVDHNESRAERTKGILVDNGYAVVPAKSVEEAERFSDSLARIDLIISGVVFPGLSGVHLAEHVETSRREVSTLLISHFHPDVLRGVTGFARQPEFLQNHFTPEDLLGRVRQLLE